MTMMIMITMIIMIMILIMIMIMIEKRKEKNADPTSFDLTYSVLLTRNYANMSNNFAAGELSGDSCHKSTKVASLGLTLHNPSDNLDKNIVKSVDENSLVGQTGAVHVGDEVLAVNKIPLHRLSCKQAEDIIENEYCNNENISLTIRKSGRRKTRPSRIFAQESFDSAVGSHNPSFDNVRLYNPCALNKVTSRSKFVVEAEVHHSLDDLGTNKHPTKYHRPRMDSPQLPTQQPPVQGKFNVASKFGDKNDSVCKNVKIDVNSPARNLKEFHISPETRKNIYRNIKTRSRCMTMDFYKQSIDEDDDAFDFNVNTSENNDNSSVENKVNQPTTFESSLDYIDEPDRNIIRATSKKIEALAEDVDEMLDMIKTSEQSNKNFIKQLEDEDANCGRGDVERSGENIPHHDDNDKHEDYFIRELPSELKLKNSLDRLEHLLRDIDDVSLFYQSGQFNDSSDKDQVIKKAASDDTSDVVIEDDYDEKYVTLLSSVDQVQPASSANKSSSSSPSDKKLTQLFNFLDLVSDPNENLCQGEDTWAEDSPDRGPVLPASTCNSSQATTSFFSPTVTIQTPSAGIISGDEAKISNNLVDTDNSDEKNIIIINEKNVNNIKNLVQFLIVSSSLGGTYFESTKLSAQSGGADTTSNTNCTFSNKTTNNNADGDDSDDNDGSELSRVTKHLTSKTTPHVLPITVTKHFHNITITKDGSANLPASTTSCFCYLPYITSCLVVTPLNSDNNVTTSLDNLHSTVIQISSSAIPLLHPLTSSSPSTLCTSPLLSSSLLSVSQPSQSLSSLLFLQLPSLKSTASSTSSAPSSSTSSAPSSSTSSAPSSSTSSAPSSSTSSAPSSSTSSAPSSSTSSAPSSSTSSAPSSSSSASSLPMSTPPTSSQPSSSTSFSPSQIPSQSSEDKKCSVARQHVTGNTENKQNISELRDNCNQPSSNGNASHSIDFRKNKLLNSNYFFNAETSQLNRSQNAEKNIHAIDRDIIHRKEVSEKNAEAAIPFDDIDAKKAIDNVLAFPNIHKNKFSGIIKNDSAAVNKSHTDNELPQDLRRDSTPSSDYDEWSQMFETIKFSSTESFTDETICNVKNERDSKLVNDISLSLNTIPSSFSFAPPSSATAKTAPPQFAPMHDQSQSAPTINKSSEKIMSHYAQVVKNLKAPPSMAVYEENIKMGGTANERSIVDDAVNFNLNNSEVAIVGENCRHGLPKKRLQNNHPTPHQPQIKTRQQRHKQQHLQQFKQQKQDSQQLKHFVRLSQQNITSSQNVRISHVNPERLSQTPIEIIRAILSKRKDADSFGFGLSNGVHEPGVFVCGIMAGGAADNILQLYDKVLQVNKVNIKNLSSNEVVDLIKKAGDILELVPLLKFKLRTRTKMWIKGACR
ncbi:hypothetical protein HELRODRAFT_188911 [Helobdella robusta]|uniref:PDZ domain-containing protein n=1 Tax=Helobdella robusta TaxID=6412 RepID=T1FQH0_HELRO|nr:hypothetical protein HELRODRAFT_188911 [Helobdella robusta]ESN98797.1 hypothetical protein HELRODRAFT_188911 [Helobdella robusta]